VTEGAAGSSGQGPEPEAKGPEKVVEVYPPPEPEPPAPSLKQYFIGWGAIFLALVLVGVIFGVLMRVLR